ncbi:MAG: lysophospholipid acyltransferase family protein [Chlorobiaceae bacterium]|nr:lysophospholipid acyltransferase family protein [Chlorobiaceae bacterium]
MKSRRNLNGRISEKILFVLVIVIGFIVRSISRKASTVFAHFFGDFVFYIARYRVGIVLKNISLAFPEKTPEEIKAIARNIYRNQGENIIEILRIPKIKTAGDASRVMDLDPAAILSKSIGRNKGGVIVSAHFGNWELLAHCAGFLIHPHTIVVKSLKNKLLDREINRLRTLHGNRVIYDGTALREGLGILRNGGILALLGDQSRPGDRFYSDFMGRSVPVALGPAYFALKAGVPLFVILCRRNGDGRYTVDIEEIDTTEFGSSRADVENVTRRYTKIFEREIRRYPEEWFWLHDRWKRSQNVKK